jgi:hypothetical protein
MASKETMNATRPAWLMHGLSTLATLTCVILCSCGSSGDGGTTPSPSTNPQVFTGVGAEISGNQTAGQRYVGEISAPTGFFATGDYAIDGQTIYTNFAVNTTTHQLKLQMDPVGAGPYFDLTANATTRQYTGTTSYTESEIGSPMEGWLITNTWNVFTADGVVQANVTGLATKAANPDQTGTIHISFYNPYNPNSVPTNYYDGWVTASSDARFVNNAIEYSLKDSSSYPTIGVFNEQFDFDDYANPFCYRLGNTIKGGDFFVDSNPGSNKFFEKLTITMSGYDAPLSGTTVFKDFVDAKTYTCTIGTIVPEKLGAALSTRTASTYDLTPTVVSGTVLSSYYSVGTAVLDGFRRDVGDSTYHRMIMVLPGIGSGLNADPMGYPGWDFANTWYIQTYNRHNASTNGGNIILRVHVSMDPTTHDLVTGHLDLYHVDVNGGIVAPAESMDFTLN